MVLNMIVAMAFTSLMVGSSSSL